MRAAGSSRQAANDESRICGMDRNLTPQLTRVKDFGVLNIDLPVGSDLKLRRKVGCIWGVDENGFCLLRIRTHREMAAQIADL
jgi:hypothetical protein